MNRGPARSSVALSLALGVLVQGAVARSQATPPGSSPARELTTYEVRNGDSCEAIARHLYGHGRYYYIVLRALGPTPDVLRTTCDRMLRPGTELELPSRIPEERRAHHAKLTTVVRRVRSRPPREGWRQARPGQQLFRSWRINTLERSEAEITFRDDSIIHVREETLVIILGPTAELARRSSSRAILEKGSLRSHLGALRGHRRLEIETPTASADLNGGDAVVSVDRERTSHVANHSGRPANVRGAKGNGVIVPAGMGTSVRRGRSPERPRPLLPAPRWAGNEARLVVTLPGRGGTLEGSWRAVEGATRYRVEVTREAHGADPVAGTEGPARVTNFELRNLPPGSYHVTTAAIDENGLEGPPSEAREVEVAQLAPSPSTIDSHPLAGDGSIAYLGLRLVAPRGVSCAIGRQPPASEIVFSELGQVELLCSDAEGRAATELMVDVRPLPVSAQSAPPSDARAELDEPTFISPPASHASPANRPQRRWRLELDGPWRLSDPWGVYAAPGTIGVRDESRRATDIRLLVGAMGPRGTAENERLAVLGLGVSFWRERLRIELGVPVAPVGDQSGLSLGVGSLVLRRSRWGVALEIAAWLPYRRDAGDRYHLALSAAADLSFRPHPRVAVRSRQALQTETLAGGTMLWASAYAVDYRMAGPFSTGLEAVLLLGREDGSFRVAPALGATLSLSRRLWVVSVLFRGGLNDDAEQLLGRFTVIASLRVGESP